MVKSKTKKKESVRKKNIESSAKEQSSFRRISKSKYIMAGVLTLLIFSLGLSLGLVLEEQRYNKAERITQEQEVSYLSLQLQYIFLNTFEAQENCAVLSTTLQDSIDDLSGSLSKIIDYEKDNKINEEEYELIRRRYTLDNLRYWLLADQAKESCNFNTVSILYFYSDECPSCPIQGTILTYFKKLLEEQLLVFPINLDLKDDEPMIEAVMSVYNITKYPTIVIEGNKYEGVIKKDELQEIICSHLEESEDCEYQSAIED
jgi:thiol-disulfide isomerase/thioredoxin